MSPGGAVLPEQPPLDESEVAGASVWTAGVEMPPVDGADRQA
jgi:hypothetical protein